MSHLYIVPSALVLLLLSGCGAGVGLIVGSGELATEERSVGEFHSLESTGFIDTVVEIGELTSVSITCDDNALEYIETRVQNDTLILATRPGVVIETDLDCYAVVVAHAFDELTSSGSGEVRCDEILDGLRLVGSTGSGDVMITGATTVDLVIGATGSGGVGLSDVEADAVELVTSGSGNVALLGTARTLDLASTGSGAVLARDLVTEDVDLSNTGSGNVEVHATESIVIDLTGSGDVDVWGDPIDRDATVTGSGEVVYH
jgi:hypothetical protein